MHKNTKGPIHFQCASMVARRARNWNHSDKDSYIAYAEFHAAYFYILIYIHIILQAEPLIPEQPQNNGATHHQFDHIV